MSLKSIALKQEREEIRSKKSAQLDIASDASKPQEARTAAQDEFKKLQARFAELEGLIVMAEVHEADEARAAEAARAESRSDDKPQPHQDETQRRRQPRKSEETRAQESFRLVATMRKLAEGRSLEGLAKELDQAGRSEAVGSNVSPSGAFVLPSFMTMNDPEARSAFAEKRAQSATGGSSGSEGGVTIATEVGPLINILESNLFLERIGVTMLRGLTSNLDLPRNTSDLAAVWEGEIDDSNETTGGFDKISMTPKRLAAFWVASKQLLAQSSVDVENWGRQRLNFAINKAVTTAAISGNPSSNPLSPRGIIYTAGIGSVVIGTNGGAPTWGKIVDLETAVAVADADLGRLAYLTTAGIRGKLKQTEKASSTGMFIWTDTRYRDQRIGELNAYDAHASSVLPTNLVKGSSSDCHPIIFGNWADQVIGQWAGLDFTLDNITLAGKAQVKITVNSWWDIAVQRAASFAAILDARTV